MNPNGDARRVLPGRFIDRRRVTPCMDCHVDTFDEYFMIHHDLWRRAVGHRAGYLCVTCLEHRLGRRLDADDFLACGANDLEWRKTPRLVERMTART